MSYPHHLAGADAPPPTQPTAREVAAARSRALDAAVARMGQPRSARPARLAGCLEVFRAEANAANPGRDRASDGWIGDEAHAARISKHNPDAAGVVRALDVDVDGLDLPAAFEKARAYVAASPSWLPFLRDGGCLILNRRITKADWSGWAVYTGTDPHTGHGHVETPDDPAAYDDRRPWLVFTDNPWPGQAPDVPAPAPAPVSPVDVRRLERGPNNYPDADPRHNLTAALQTRIRTRYPLYGKRLTSDGWFGAATETAVREFQRRSPGLAVDGVAGPATLGRLGL